MMRAAAGVVCLALLLCLGIGGAGADEVSAKFYTDRGAKLLASRDYEQARTQYEKALQEKEGYAPALLGLARLAANGDEPEQAIPWLEACLEQEAGPGLSKDEQSAVAKARKLFRKLDRPRLDLRDILSSFQSKLLDIASRYEKTDPALAKRCLERILQVCPEHPEAKRRLKGVAPAAAAPLDALGGNRDELFNGKNFDGWAVNPAIWKVAGGCIEADPGADSFTIRGTRKLGATYTLEVELRTGGGTAQSQLIGVTLGEGNPTSYAFVLLDAEFAIIRSEGPDMQIRKKVPFAEVFDEFSREEWHTLRLEVRGRTLKVSVDGKEALTFEGPNQNDFAGYMGLWAQRTRMYVRRVSLVN